MRTARIAIETRHRTVCDAGFCEGAEVSTEYIHNTETEVSQCREDAACNERCRFRWGMPIRADIV